MSRNLPVDPNTLICPDYSADEYATARADFTSDAITNALAAQILSKAWTVTNNADKAIWKREIDRVVAEKVEALRVLSEAETTRTQASIAEKQEEEKEAVRKNCSKFLPIPKRTAPLVPSVIPSAYALRKLAKGDYLEMYYFTNEGLAEAKKTTADDEAMLPITDAVTKAMSWIPAAAKRDSSTVIPDGELSWNQFYITMPRMLQAMSNARWVPERITMLSEFWAALINHPYRSSPAEVDNQTLLVYQAEQRLNWHHAIDTPEGAWDIGIIEPTLLRETRQRVSDDHEARINAELRFRVSFLFCFLIFSSPPVLQRKQPVLRQGFKNIGQSRLHSLVQWHHVHSGITSTAASHLHEYHTHISTTSVSISHRHYIHTLLLPK